ncbi:hypothetical protein P7H89_07005 [Lactococcus lactis]|nr:hypothetical protein [Lactococcus lactis]MDT2861314.1 hypothetical protein [Lactococcus lactis]MDT2870674.1 hypothetical protein [Lactococcus lactis]MDT2889552.1 hypothetical protein [Lactococcus lactis]MDT2892239.1 hypothetical protein [Lactococcus lactis]MDT2912448.1 hypothetical protein [Lactococcus lactis]
MSDKVIMVYTVNDASAFVFNQTLDNMKVIENGKIILTSYLN